MTLTGFEVLNPVRGEQPPTAADAKPWDWYMRRALEQLLQADGIVLLQGWADSRGASLENYVAGQLGMPVGSLYEWLSGGIA